MSLPTDYPWPIDAEHPVEPWLTTDGWPDLCRLQGHDEPYEPEPGTQHCGRCDRPRGDEPVHEFYAEQWAAAPSTGRVSGSARGGQA